MAALDPGGVILRALCAVPQESVNVARYRTWWDWASKGQGLGPLPGSPVRVRVEGASLPAMYDRLSRSYWLLVFPAPVGGTWVALHGTMRVPPEELALQQIQLTDLPAAFPLPDWGRAGKPRRLRPPSATSAG